MPSDGPSLWFGGTFGRGVAADDGFSVARCPGGASVCVGLPGELSPASSEFNDGDLEGVIGGSGPCIVESSFGLGRNVGHGEGAGDAGSVSTDAATEVGAGVSR